MSNRFAALAREWIRERSDVEEIEGRAVTPIDDGYLSEKHAAHADRTQTANAERPMFEVRRKQRKICNLESSTYRLSRKPLAREAWSTA